MDWVTIALALVEIFANCNFESVEDILEARKRHPLRYRIGVVRAIMRSNEPSLESLSIREAFIKVDADISDATPQELEGFLELCALQRATGFCSGHKSP